MESKEIISPFIWASPECFPGFCSSKGPKIAYELIDHSVVINKVEHEKLVPMSTDFLECSNFSKEVRND